MLKKCQSILKPETKAKIAQTKEEIEAHFFIRKQVFVEEQRIFEGSDRDEHDEKAIPLVCEVDGHIAGTVRVYPLTNGTWVGGRLAVLKEFRVYKVGQLLVKEAVRTVKKKGCSTFLACIQPRNVQFFRKLGWMLTGKEETINGITHQVMKADLNKWEGKKACEKHR